MTEDRQQAAIESIAEELSRLAHDRPDPDNEEIAHIDECVRMAMLIRGVTTLCYHHIVVLHDLVDVLHELQSKKFDEDRAVQ